MSAYRNVLVLIVAVGILQLAGGLLGVITPLGLTEMGLSPTLIGVVAALHAVGFMVGAATAPRGIALFGNIRVYSAAAAITAAAALSMALEVDPVFWAASRLVQGICFAWMFTSLESWLSSATPANRRGGVNGLYHVCAKAALMLGPFLAAGVSALSPEPILWCGIFLALSLVPVCTTRIVQPDAPATETMSSVALFRLAPAGLIGAFAAGLTNTGTTAMLPIFAQSMVLPGESATTVAAQAAAAAYVGGLISQWPAGRVSDRIDRRLVVAVMALFAGAMAVLIALGLGAVDRSLTMLAIGAWGAGSLSTYGISVAHAIDRARADQIPQVMSGLLFVWAIGSVIGPPLFGLAMRAGIGQQGLFVATAIASFALAGAMLFRRNARDPVPEADSEPWEAAHPLSLAGSEMDPRSPD